MQIECQLSYLLMLISNGICQYAGRYAVLNKKICHFWDRNRASFPEKIQSTGTYQNDATRHCIFFPENTLGYGPAFWIFLP